MRTFPRLLAVAVAAILAVGCSGAADDDVAATVDGSTITFERLENTVLPIVGNTSEMNADERSEVSSYERQFLGYFIQDLVYDRAIEQSGAEFGDEQFASALEAEIAGLGGEGEYEAQLEEMGITTDLFETLVRLDARQSALREHVVDEEPARAVRHILVETEDEATDLLEQLEDGADFAELAAEHSIDPGSAEAGGEYPPAPRGSWVPEFDEAVWEAEVGELVGPVQTTHGYHIIEVLDETVLTAEDLDPQQLEQLTAGEVGAILEEAFQSAEIDVAASVGDWDREAREIVLDEVGVAPDGAPPLPTE